MNSAIKFTYRLLSRRSLQSTNLTLLVLCLGLLLPSHSSSTVIESLSINEVVAQSTLIFSGDVTAVRVEQAGPNKLVTIITFDNIEIIKGAHTEQQLQLRFLGGTLGNRTLQVVGSRYPRHGESGIYFVESLSAGLINPLLGWSQGHYLIQADENNQGRITTVEGKPVLGISPQAAEVGAPALVPPPISPEPNSRGIITGEPQQGMSRGMRPESFIDQIQQMLNP
jgi:hypothetical protein